MSKLKITVAVVLGVLVLGLLFNISSDKGFGGASGLSAVQRIATTTAVGPDEVITIFANKAQCSSRVISTTGGSGQAISILFGAPTNGDVTTPTELVGHLQAGSTTIMYDGDVYGCGAWKAFATATTTILVSEFN